MSTTQPLETGRFYHIYNRANGSENLFREAVNYRHFLHLYDKYISPIAHTFAWVLMPNHFHLLVWIKEGMVYRYSPGDFKTPSNVSSNAVNSSASTGPDGVNNDVNTNEKRKKANPTRHFSHLFNAYTKHLNEKYGRHGNLFQRPFKRKLIDDEDYLRRVAVYIHNNPVHHGFVDHLSEYPWSSYHTCMSSKPTKLQREVVLDWFGGASNFKNVHHEYFNHIAVEAWLEEKKENDTD